MEEMSERINLPMTPTMYEAVKQRARSEGLSAVGFIRRCIEYGLREQSKLVELEKRLQTVEALLSREPKKRSA